VGEGHGTGEGRRGAETEEVRSARLMSHLQVPITQHHAAYGLCHERRNLEEAFALFTVASHFRAGRDENPIFDHMQAGDGRAAHSHIHRLRSGRRTWGRSR
jgi:hypothetical protein